MEIGTHVSVEDVVSVGRFKERVEISEETRKKLEESRKVVDRIVNSGEAVYGINTGLGALANVRISHEKLKDLQRNLLLSHAAGYGKPLDEEIVRGMMFLRAVSLSKGFSGVRPVVVERIIDFLNRGVVPYVPSHGSVGASGDLAPLAHTFLPLMGMGYVLKDGKAVPSGEVLKEIGIPPLELREKEGLALVNGTQAMSSLVSFVIRDSIRLIKLATLVFSISFEALRGRRDAFDPRVHSLRPHPGQMEIAKAVWELTKGSEIERDENKVQDAYTLRTVPQVYGAVLDTINYAKEIMEREINSVTDNPIVFPEGDAISGGNFHGEPVALVADFLAIALTDLGNMIERRIDRILNPKTNEGLPAFLSFGEKGLNSGYMLYQYTAASLCNENKVLSSPASSDTIPTSAYQEDHVSMGMNSALKLKKILENLETILAIELMISSVALKMRGVERSAPKVRDFASKILDLIKIPDRDDFFWEDFQKVLSFVKNTVEGKEKIA